MSPRFVHLHLHSEYSLVDSTIRIPDLVRRCVDAALPAAAITDESNLFGLVKFYKEAEAAGIKPIAGADVRLADDAETPTRLTLLCRDHAGYLALARLLSRAYLEGHHGHFVALRPQWLYADCKGLIMLAGRESPVGEQLKAGRFDGAERILGDWQRIFGDALYLELVRSGRQGEDAFNAAAIELAARRGLPLVASNDVRFLDRDDFEAHEARVCIAQGRVLDDPKRPRDYSPEQSLRSADEMAALFADVPEALENTVELAKRCNFELSLGKYHLPAFPVPSEHTLDTWIRAQAAEGLAARLRKQPPAEGFTHEDYARRLDGELGTIVSMGFAGYFLIVADFINWAKDRGIPVGPGRGSGAGSLAAYALGITDLDPLRYDLLFERFLNPERVSMPDFDIDFCMDRRDEVIDYVAGKYGRDRVSQIITYGTMAAKAVVRDCGRVLGHPYGFVDGIAKAIPLTLGITLDDALGMSDAAMRDSTLSSSELIERYRSEEEVRDLIDLARKLEDLTRNAGKHAGGVVIAPTPLTDFAPLFAEHAARGETAKSIVTQFDKDDVEAIGLVKFDFLGLRTLTIIDWAVKAVNRRESGIGNRESEKRAPLDVSTIPLDDRKTYGLFARGETVAVFQFESRGMRDLLKRALPDRFEDLIALVSLFRPGPMDLIPEYIERKHGRQAVKYPEARLAPILDPTYGIMVYQEQVMQIAQSLGGYTLGGADLLRRAMGKKKPDEMAKQRVIFQAGAENNGIDAHLADTIFDQMEKFAGYGFNKSHAAAYALVSYQTAWLKAHYPAEFMAAVLSSDMDNTDKVVGFLEEARALGLTVLPPEINVSGYMFEAVDARGERIAAGQPVSRGMDASPTPSADALERRSSAKATPLAERSKNHQDEDSSNMGMIRYGLGAVKGVGRGAVEAIVDERRNGAYADLLDFCRRVESGKLNRRVLEALIHAGALDALGRNRATLLLQLPEVLKATEQLAREREAGQVSLFGGMAAHGRMPEQRIALPECEDWPLERKLIGERDTLGHYLSGHPMDPWRGELASLIGITLADLDRVYGERRDRRGEAAVTLAGMVVSMRRRGDSQAFVQLEDGHGRIECAFFSEAFAAHAALLSRDRILVIEGGLREDEFSGGYSLRARACWDFRQLCAQNGRCLSLTLDLRERDVWERFEKTLTPFRPGGTPLRLEIVTGHSRGTLDFNGAQSVRADPELLGALRAMPGISAVSLSLQRLAPST